MRSAKEIGLDQISFLPADVSTSAFNHNGTLRPGDIALTEEEVNDFKSVIDRYVAEFDSKFIAESVEKIKRIPLYYLALLNKIPFESPPCNAPWVSAVLESDGRLMPCFFHHEYGNIHDNDFEDILNSEKAIEFRKNLDVKTNEVCKKCVCSLKLRAI